MRRGTLDLLACPSCRGGLRLKEEVIPDRGIGTGRLHCTGCDAEYPVERGVPRLIPSEAPVERWDEWEEKQQLGLQEYEAEASDRNESFGDVAAEFGAFCALTGTILDVGCGISASPPYAILPPGSFYVGVDPLDSGVEREFEFVEGVGEQLPFRNAVFDRVVAATSLDHFAAPVAVLAEIRRVMKPSGALGIWIGVLDVGYFEKMYALPSLRDPEARRQVIESLRSGDLGHIAALAWRHGVANRSRSVLLRLRRLIRRPLPVAKVFEERARYHFHFYSEPEIYELLRDCGFDVVRRRLVEDSVHGNSLFVIASPSQPGVG